MSGVMPPLPNTHSWGGAQLKETQGQLYFTLLYFTLLYFTLLLFLLYFTLPYLMSNVHRLINDEMSTEISVVDIPYSFQLKQFRLQSIRAS
jgi:hypothetical protein